MVSGSNDRLLLQMLIMALCMIPMIVTVRDGANSSGVLAEAPISSLKHEPIPSVSELGGVFAEDDGTNRQGSRDVGGANPRS